MTPNINPFISREAYVDKRKYFSVGFMLLLIFVIYFNSVYNGFTNWDDQMIYANTLVRSLDWENILDIFTPERGATYQPIRVLSYAIDYHFWKLNPMGYRITNILFYMLTCIMVFLTLRLLSSHLRDRASPESHFRVALFGSLLFAAHPVHVEAVTWLSARKEVLQGFFFFGAFYLYLKGREEVGRRKLIYLGMVLFSLLLAILSKPSAVVFPGVILVYEIARARERWFDFVKQHWGFFAIGFFLSTLFIFVLIKVMLEAGGFKPYRGGNFINNFLISFYAFIYNIKLLVATINYSAAYTIPVSNPVLSLKTFFFVALAILLLSASLWSLKKTKVFFFSTFFFLVTVSPFLNIFPISTLLADRYVFIASFAYCFLLGIAFDKLYTFRHRRFSESFFKLLSFSIFLLLLSGYSFLTIQQNKVWENSYTLWSDAVAKYPESNTANALMGVVYMDLGMDEEAIKYLEKAIQILPYDYQSRNNLGIVYGRIGEFEKAYEELMLAMHLDPENDNVKINLGILFLRQKQFQKAEEVFKYLLERRPDDAQLYYRLAYVYKEWGKYDQAISELEKASALAPHVINPYEELGNIYISRLMDRDKAIQHYTKGVEVAIKSRAKGDELRWMVQDLQR